MKLSKIKIQYVLLAPFVVVLLMQFNNCSKYKQPQEQSSIAPGTSLSELGQVKGITPTGDLCEDQIRQHFYEGYYQTLVANCIQCHAVDNDKPQFANPDANWAYEVFQTRGFTKISNNAISSTHNPPATGPHLTSEINELKTKWRVAVDEYNSCKGLPPVVEAVDPREIINLQTASRTIGTLAVNASRTIVWNVNTDIQALKTGAVLPAIPGGAKFSIKVTRRQTAAGTDYYTFSEPAIYDNINHDLKVKTLYIKLNGRVMNYATTFKFVDKFIYRATALVGGTTPADNALRLRGLVSAGGLMVLGTVSSNDVINVAFEVLKEDTAPVLPPPATVGFADTSVRFVNPSSAGLDANRRMRVRVQVAGNAEAPIVMSVAAVNDPLCGANGETAFVVNGSTCLPNVNSLLTARGINNANNTRFNRARSVDGGSFNRFDWDYKLINPSFTLLGNNAFAEFEVEFSGDIRRENNRVLRLRLEDLSGNGNIVNGEIYIVIHKADNENALANGEMTFSALMRTGTLKNYCLECHNSRDLNGGYDVTNYKLMVTNGVLDLSNPINSKMFNRMNPNYPGNATLAPMPRDGYLPDAEIDPVRRWIQAGAKNN